MSFGKNTFVEGRQHKRFPAMRNLIKPVELIFRKPATFPSIPAVLLDLSAGGAAVLAFVPIEPGTKIDLKVDFAGLVLGAVEAEVIDALSRREAWRIGFKFTKISAEDVVKLNQMADDFAQCEEEIQAKPNYDVCTDKCRYFMLCEKPQKIKK